jgi:hypothetical protein
MLSEDTTKDWLTQPILKQLIHILDYSTNRRRFMELIQKYYPNLIWEPEKHEIVFHTDRELIRHAILQ